MSEPASDTGGFNPLMVAGVIIVGVIAFIALWALIALGPQLSSGNDGGGHALSKGAPGYAGIVDLLDRAETGVSLRRREDAPADGERTLLILTPMHDSKPDDIARLIKGHRGGPVLIVLPKWQAGRLPQKPGWVGPGLALPPSPKILPPSAGPVDKITNEPSARGAVATGFFGGREMAVALPDLRTQVVTAHQFDTLLAFPHGGAILAKYSGSGIYVLSEPDLINNLAFSSGDRARSAALLLDAIAEDAEAEGISFDVTLGGFGSQRSLLRFAFVPPFIGITLCLIAAGLLALWQAWMRFGPALKPTRAIAMSKAALIANSADLIKQARRELDGADAYVHSQRLAIARRLHAPSGLDTAATDAWIDKRLKTGSDLFSALARRLPLARNRHEFLGGAQALNDIRKELLRDG